MRQSIGDRGAPPQDPALPMPTALVITAAGINCDLELARAFALAGARVESIHLHTLVENPTIIDRFDLIGLPGGFSYGDAVAAGRIMAHLIRQRLFAALAGAVERGVPIFAPCNGFQIAVQAGLLPGPAPGEAWPSEAPTPVAALSVNQTGRFADRWTRVEIPDQTRCIWTQGLTGPEAGFMLPNAHGEGRFVAENALLDQIEGEGQVAIRYAEGDNFNGSMRRVAGICDATGLVFGLMPHPERFTRWTQHPYWTRLSADERSGETIGLQMFRNAVRWVEARQARREVLSMGR